MYCSDIFLWCYLKGLQPECKFSKNWKDEMEKSIRKKWLKCFYASCKLYEVTWNWRAYFLFSTNNTGNVKMCKLVIILAEYKCSPLWDHMLHLLSLYNKIIIVCHKLSKIDSINETILDNIKSKHCITKVTNNP